MANVPQPLRWQYRFDNYGRALARLREAIGIAQERPLSQLEKEGVVQRFEYTMELAWKTMKDYLDSQNVVFDTITPRSVIREAFAAGLIADGQVWMDALDDRNRMSHNYNVAEFERVILAITNRYAAILDAFSQNLARATPSGPAA